MNAILVTFFVGLSLAFADDALEFSNGNRIFSANIYKELAGNNEGNFVGCPMSVQMVMSMVHAGARHKTAEQLATGLSLPNSVAKIGAMIQSILPKFVSDRRLFTMRTANKLYVASSFKLNEDFVKTAADVYNVEAVNLIESVEAINRWVADQTENHIKDLLAEGDIDGGTQAILVNALYFEARWMSPFDFHSKKTIFHTIKAGPVEVDMMTSTNYYPYFESDRLNAKFLKLNYHGKDLSMVVVLPNDKDGLAQLENNVHEVLHEQNYTLQGVIVNFPKFNMDTTIKFVPILKKLGVVDLFTNNADLSGMTATPVQINDVVQKNHIEVNEKGTIAASATAAVIGLSGVLMPKVPKQFIADHPFLYYIQSEAGILFVGRYSGH